MRRVAWTVPVLAIVLSACTIGSAGQAAGQPDAAPHASTQAAAPQSAMRSSRDWSDTSSLSGKTDAPISAFSFGYCALDRAATTSISARACSSVAPARRRPTTYIQLLFRST